MSRSPARTITSIASFQETGIPACVLNRTSHLDFIRQARRRPPSRTLPPPAAAPLPSPAACLHPYSDFLPRLTP